MNVSINRKPLFWCFLFLSTNFCQKNKPSVECVNRFPSVRAQFNFDICPGEGHKRRVCSFTDITNRLIKEFNSCIVSNEEFRILCLNKIVLKNVLVNLCNHFFSKLLSFGKRKKQLIFPSLVSLEQPTATQ